MKSKTMRLIEISHNFKKRIVKSFFDDGYSIRTISNQMKLFDEDTEDVIREYCFKNSARKKRIAMLTKADKLAKKESKQR